MREVRRACAYFLCSLSRQGAAGTSVRAPGASDLGGARTVRAGQGPALTFLSLGHSKRDCRRRRRLLLSPSPTYLRQVGNAQHKDNRVQNVGLARPVKALETE